MVLTIKLSSFAYNIYDGRKWAEIQNDTGDKRKDKVLEARRRYALRTMPSVLEYLGYVFCFSSILAGPAFEYSEYIGAVTGASYQKNGAPSRMRGNVMPALGKLAVGLFCLVTYQLGSPYFAMADVPTEKVLSLGIFSRGVHVWVTMFFCRMKYFFAWKVADGASVMGGFGFEGYDKMGKAIGWNGVRAMFCCEYVIHLS
ncbi:unnamed protein product [Choristocarpus tenellus]